MVTPAGSDARRAAARTGEPPGALWSRLTARDRRVLELVEQHRVLTTEQLHALEFDSRRRAQHRLAELFRLGVLWRFRFPLVAGGSMPWHYTLGYQGARLQAAQRGVDPPRPATFAARLERLAESPKLRHQLGVNDVFAGLAGYARRTGLPPDEGLQVWRSEADITAFYADLFNVSEYGPRIRPDGYGCWVQGGRVLGFHLEYDTGTETLGRVADKLDVYSGENGRTAEHLHGMILFWVHSTQRETALRRALTRKTCPVPIATAARDYGDPDGPAGSVWSVLNQAGRHPPTRLRLAELAAAIGGTDPAGKPSVLVQRHMRALQESGLLDPDHALNRRSAEYDTQPIPRWTGP